ncbi:DUF6896 domain-containing protein [Pseudomonas vanderleydeniana]|uniref:DUF6896 domain-containing protein n=1 Tax=Pseudomonas vanderleydeniana TaxID=2745495 RepID=A0A9E6TQC0_9PSED|nr:hypothetical protein [Pseudomonas vanderleydeniana]QXI26366.1 hypothetical protein HU752_020755 [Pseudomonas vanderleydeniana]
MDKRLTSLIIDYQKAVRTALTLMKASGVALPGTAADWVFTDLSNISCLNDGVNYYKHGFGCRVDLPEGSVDFDFGRFGEISGFDSWRLLRFAKDRHETYGFADDDEFFDCFSKSERSNEIIPLSGVLCRLAKESMEYVYSIGVADVCDALPHRDMDEVLTLNIHYFYSAELMLKNLDLLVAKRKKHKKLSFSEKVNYRIYMSSWLGYLAVTCEGYRSLSMYLLLNDRRPVEYRDLIPECNALNSSIAEHYHALRKYRNNVFHLRESVEDTLGFISSDERISWARKIHGELKSFFSNYRVLCEFYYILNERSSEASLGRSK